MVDAGGHEGAYDGGLPVVDVGHQAVPVLSHLRPQHRPGAVVARPDHGAVVMFQPIHRSTAQVTRTTR